MRGLIWGLSFCAVLFLSGCEPKAAPYILQNPEVTVAEAAYGDIFPSMIYVAKAEGLNSVDLRARVEGYLTRRCFTEGQYVRNGDLLFEIEDVNYKAELAVAEGNLTRCKAALENARKDYIRQEQLLKQNATARQAFDATLFAVKEAEGNFRAQEGTVVLARQKLAYTRITAPFDGQVGLARYSVGNLVNPESDALANITHTNQMRVRFNLSEVDLLGFLLERTEPNVDTEVQIVRLQQSLRVNLIFQNGKIYPLEGQLSFLNNRINAGMGTLIVEAVFDNPEQLLVPGMYVKVRIEQIQARHALMIPQRAITQTQAGDQVITVDSQNMTDIRIIKTGLRYGTAIEVLSGLKVGERVITEGLLKASRRGLEVRAIMDLSSVKSPLPQI